MADFSRNEINSNFYQIVETDPTGNIIAIKSEYVPNANVSPGGTNLSVQFNSDGTLDGTTNFLFDVSSNTVIADAFAGSGTQLTNILATNIDGTVANAAFADQSATANVANVAVVAQTANVAAVATTAITANIANVANVANTAAVSLAIEIPTIDNAKIGGGNPNDVISTDGNGNLTYRSIVENLIVVTRNQPVQVSINNYTMTVETRTGNVTVYVN
jgi:hypothetical protein